MTEPMTPVGGTARWIAAARALESESEAPLFSDPFARELAGELGFELMDRFRQLAGPQGPRTGPDLYLSIRTRFLDDALLGAVTTQRLTQVVILAAGMDTRAFRLDWPAGTTVFELDRDDVFDWKEPILERLGAVPRADRRVIRVDLAGEWLAGLLEAGFAPDEPAAFLVEGLLMYLPPSVVDELMSTIASIAADGSWIGLDAVNPEMLSSPFTAPYMKTLADAGVPWQFGMPDAELFFARHGWYARVVIPGEPDANYGRWAMPTIPRTIPGIPRTFYVVADRGAAARPVLPMPVSTRSAEHYTWGQGCDGWHLVKQAGLSVIEELMPVEASEQRHRHARARQFFYVLAGRLEIEVEGMTHALETGSGLEIPPVAAHRVRNPGPDRARFLVVSQPHAHGDREAAPVNGMAPRTLT